MSSTISIDIHQRLCADPVGGSIYKHLFNGGSWFEADQMHWRLEQELALNQLKALVEAKATKANQEKAREALTSLHECARQLIPQNDAMALFPRSDQIVKTWVPAPKAVAKSVKGINVFAALGDSEEEE